MSKKNNDLPNYDAEEQGLDEDFRETPLSSHDRQARTARYAGTKQAARSAAAEGTTADAIRASLAATTESHTRAKRSDRAVIYLRVSTEEQARVGGTAEGYSIPYQRDACHRKADALGLAVVEEYVDAGHSAKSANRPQLQRMLRELRERGVGWVIVHKIDRLARNTRDDHKINDAITAAGARLLSVVDLIDDSPQGKFNYTIQAGLAQLYTDNLAIEVMKGLSKKAQAVGTPYRRRLATSTASLRRRRRHPLVEVDPERSPRSGGRSRITPRELVARPAAAGADRQGTDQLRGQTGQHQRPVQDPYQRLLHRHRAVPRRLLEGTHPPLVDLQTWLLVQQTLEAQLRRREGVNPQSLPQGSIWSGVPARASSSRNRGKTGIYYDYSSRWATRKRNNCTRKAVLVSRFEAGVEAPLPPPRRTGRTNRGHPKQRRRRFARLKPWPRRTWPEPAPPPAGQRTTTETAGRPLRRSRPQGHAQVRDAAADGGGRLGRAGDGRVQRQPGGAGEPARRPLTIAGHCAEAYQQVPPAIRRQLNQGFFQSSTSRRTAASRRAI